MIHQLIQISGVVVVVVEVLLVVLVLLQAVEGEGVGERMP
jgi:preprotein translocase subunit SecG